MRKVRTVAVTLLIILAILILWKSTDPQETVFGAPRDAIPSVSDPSFRTGDVSFSDSYLVVGVSIDGLAKAYPVLILDWHEIVNDELSGRPIVVTYCPLCGSGIVFDRRVGDATLTFGVSGLLYRNDLVMYDHQTGSQWVQIMGEAVRGPLAGTELDMVSSRTLQLGAWREIWPDTEVMDFPTFNRDYGNYPYGDYRESGGVRYPREFVDDTLPAKEVVLGVDLGETAVAFPASVMRVETVVNHQIDGVPVVVTYYNDAMAVFRRGNATFRPTAGFYMEDDSGNRWNMVTGHGEPGMANEDEQLEEVEHITSYWFAWLDFHPDTEVYGVSSDSRRGLGFLESYWAVLLTGAVILLAPMIHGSRWMRERAVRDGAWIDLSKSHYYGGAALVLGVLIALYGSEDLRWTNSAASLAVSGAAMALGAYLIMERWKLGGYSARFTEMRLPEAREDVLRTALEGDAAEEVGGTTLWPRTRGVRYDLSGEPFILADDWAFAQTDGPSMAYLNATLWWEEEE